jgi:peptidoglycan/xylan/chitin deacetylase (PgdA/CDA1 family)
MLCGVAYRSGLLRVAAGLTEPRRGPTADGRFQILVYHRVGATADRFHPATPVGVFERQMRYLQRNFNVLSLTALLQAVERREVPARAVAVTFDDGYEDLYRYVFPIIREHGVPITVFLATGFIDSERPMWNDAVAAAVRDTRSPALGGLPDCRPMPLATPAQREEAVARGLSVLKYRPLRERDDLVAQILRSLKVPEYKGPRMLRWEQVKLMHAGGVEFGAHTVQHPILTRLAPTERWYEIFNSKRAIEERLQGPVTHFAYPNGTVRDFDDVTKALVQKAGFASAASMIFGTNTPETDRYALRRGGPSEDCLSVFATKLWWYRRQAGE